MSTDRNTYNIPERFLRQLWRNQQFSLNNLHTIDDKPIEIISPGKLNQDGGPDFTAATVRINGIVYRGDVEIHQRNEEWLEHQHNKDVKYNAVILHVVLHKDPSLIPPLTKSKRAIPVLALDQYLTSTFRSTWEKMILDERAERLATIKCYPLNNNIPTSLLSQWLEKLALERMELKIRRFEEQLKEMIGERRLQANEPPSCYGEVPFGLNPEELPPPLPHIAQSDFRQQKIWEQLLYEGVMEALGYSKNQEPFLKLSQNAQLQYIDDAISKINEEQVFNVESILFAVAGLLPQRGETLDEESKRYIRDLKNLWKEYRTTYHKEILGKSEWQFFRLRPENFPTVRIAGAARLIIQFLKHNIFKSIIRLIKDTDLGRRQKYSSLVEMFIVPATDFWLTHYRFGERSQKYLTKLIGKNRADDIVLNVVIPISLLYARIFKDKDVRHGILKIFEECPPSVENTITKIIDRQLIRKKFHLGSAMLQQGALQLYKYYCIGERCEECAVVRELKH